ncbi:hypothetical protein [Agromyces laixinhei]|uniref:hypothetical protein n=1 Tax=Agromyces laixinhei TaxID=2585717 RepID=UPI0011179F20|nr:hypothetical protein [Agromyces laixinhei]
MDTMPKRTLWWGIALSVGGALLIMFVPPLMYSIFSADGEVGQTLFSFLELVLGVVRQLVLPLGTALIAASLVMFYIRGRSQPPESDRPKRWVLPDPLERSTDG